MDEKGISVGLYNTSRVFPYGFPWVIITPYESAAAIQELFLTMRERESILKSQEVPLADIVRYYGIMIDIDLNTARLVSDWFEVARHGNYPEKSRLEVKLMPEEIRAIASALRSIGLNNLKCSIPIPPSILKGLECFIQHYL